MPERKAAVYRRTAHTILRKPDWSSCSFLLYRRIGEGLKKTHPGVTASTKQGQRGLALATGMRCESELHVVAACHGHAGQLDQYARSVKCFMHNRNDLQQSNYFFCGRL